jgi:hypothetical protein
MMSALLPLGLHELLAHLPEIILRLDEVDAPGEFRSDLDRCRPSQIHDFRHALPQRLRDAA